jgi:hypothetical protein
MKPLLEAIPLTPQEEAKAITKVTAHAISPMMETPEEVKNLL